MPRVENKTQVYGDWSGGNWGARGAVVAATDQPFKYRAINLQVYANGSIGPRPGWKLAVTSGTAPTSADFDDFWSAFWFPQANNSQGHLLFVSRDTAAQTKLLTLDTVTWSTTTLGVVVGGADGDLWNNAGSFVYINSQQVVVGGQKIYNSLTDTTTTLSFPSSFAPTRAAFYKDRLYVFGDATFQNRVYYSDFGTVTTFTAGNFFDIGPGGATAATRAGIKEAWVLKDQLVFLTSSVSFAQRDEICDLWSLQGANAITGTLSHIAKGRSLTYASHAASHHDLLVALDHLNGRGALIMGPSGIEAQALDHLRPGNDIYQYSEGRNAVSVYNEDAIILPYVARDIVDPSATSSAPVGNVSEIGLQAWELVHGVWTKSLWWDAAQGTTIDGNLQNFIYAVLPFTGTKLIALTNAGSDVSAGTWRVFTRDITLDRPSNSSDSWSDPTEPHTDVTGTPFGVDAQLWLPEEMAPLGFGVRVKKVTIDFDYWKEATYSPASTADFSIKIKYRGQKGGAQVDTDMQGGDDDSFDYLTSTTGNYPSRGRRVFTFETTPWYGSYQIVFPTLRNVAFRKVTVEYEQSPAERGS